MSRHARLALFLAAAFAFVLAILPHPPRLPGEASDKLLHMVAFFVLGALAAAGFPRLSIIRLFIALSAYGAVIEVVQGIPALHRDSELMDWVADSVAALAALWLVRKILTRA